MNSYELNKIAGAVLATGLLVMGLSITSEIIYGPGEVGENGYVIEVVSETDEGEAPEAADAIEPIAVRLQEADASAGQSAAKKCQACHTFEKGGPAKVGPNLYGVVASEAADKPGFDYSAALTEKKSEGMTWSFERLDLFLASPKSEVPGTTMAFAGVKKPDERADVIAFLRTLADSPVPLPEAPAAEEAAVEAAEGEAMPLSEEADTSGAAPMMADPDEPATGDAMAVSPPPAAETPVPAPQLPQPPVDSPAAGTAQ